MFRPENLLREARRQKSLPEIPVPPVAVLDPDGDIDMWVTDLHGIEVGVVGMAGRR